ncbi:hypothetical protein [Dactylosporangium sp. NPDC051541]|uniref:hypothetical protein n=1 Tax=Dactylosporangium sp. NPDC051541 TaxID=3363977 RepID=UPI0037AE2577
MADEVDHAGDSDSGAPGKPSVVLTDLLERLAAVIQRRFGGEPAAELMLEALETLKANIAYAYGNRHNAGVASLIDRCINELRDAEFIPLAALADGVERLVSTVRDGGLQRRRFFTDNFGGTPGDDPAEQPEAEKFVAALWSLSRRLTDARQKLEYEEVTGTVQEAREAVASAQEAASTAREAASHAQVAAGMTGGTTLASHYERHAAAERWWNIGWSVLLIALVGATVALAWFLVRGSSVDALSSREVGRLSLAVPLLLLAAYASRQARFHRDSASKSALIAVQLRTILAFGDALDQGRRSEIPFAFGVSLFSESGRPISSEPAFGLGSEVIEGLKALGANAARETKA